MARGLLPHSIFCRLSNKGQVVMPIVMAQIVAGKNGRMTHSENKIMTHVIIAPRTARVRCDEGGVTVRLRDIIGMM